MAVSPTLADFAPLLFSGDLQAGINQAAVLGFDGIEISLHDSTALDQAGIMTWLNEAGLNVPAFGTGQSYFTDRFSLADPDHDVQEQVRERLKAHIKFAAEVNATVVLGSIRGRLDDSSQEDRQRCYEIAVEATQFLSAYANEFGVKLTIEPINRYETNFINTIEEAISFIDDVGASNVGILMDTFHMNIEEASMTEGILLAGDRIWHVHLVDSNRCAPGMGHIDINEIVGALVSVGYSGYLSAEILPVPDDITAATKWMETTRNLVQRIP
jgi:sugar phosphate isomerase/epimerase